MILSWVIDWVIWACFFTFWGLPLLVRLLLGMQNDSNHSDYIRTACLYICFFFVWSWILNNRAHKFIFALQLVIWACFFTFWGLRHTATYRIPTIQVARDLRRRSCIDGVHMDCVMVRLLKKLLQSLQQFLNINIPWILVHLVTRTTIRIGL